MYRCVGVLGGEKDSSVVSVSPILTIHVWLVLIDMIRERGLWQETENRGTSCDSDGPIFFGIVDH